MAKKEINIWEELGELVGLDIPQDEGLDKWADKIDNAFFDEYGAHIEILRDGVMVLVKDKPSDNEGEPLYFPFSETQLENAVKALDKD